MSKQTGGQELLHQARKRFGQNFLHDQSVIQRIARSIAPKPEDRLIEIGPGMGALTEHLLEGCPSLTVIELDRDLVPGLRTQFFRFPDFTVVEADAMKVDYREYGEGLRLVGNLPYNISTPLIFHLLSFGSLVKDMTFMLQKEVVDRLAASPGDSSYGRLGVMAQYHARVMPLFPVGPGAFRPAPKVWSAIVRLQPHERKPYVADNEGHFRDLVRQAFSQRRKTLKNVLKGLLCEASIQACDIDPSLRPEKLNVADFVALSNQYTKERVTG